MKLWTEIAGPVLTLPAVAAHYSADNLRRVMVWAVTTPSTVVMVGKPVDFGQFTEAGRQLGLYWLGLNEPPQHRKT